MINISRRRISSLISKITGIPSTSIVNSHRRDKIAIIEQYIVAAGSTPVTGASIGLSTVADNKKPQSQEKKKEEIFDCSFSSSSYDYNFLARSTIDLAAFINTHHHEKEIIASLHKPGIEYVIRYFVFSF
jgi:hypothetical protein